MNLLHKIHENMRKTYLPYFIFKKIRASFCPAFVISYTIYLLQLMHGTVDEIQDSIFMCERHISYLLLIFNLCFIPGTINIPENIKE